MKPLPMHCGTCKHFGAGAEPDEGEHRIGLCRLKPPIYFGPMSSTENLQREWAYWQQPMVRSDCRCGQWASDNPALPGPPPHLMPRPGGPRRPVNLPPVTRDPL